MKNFNSILLYTWVCSLTLLLMPLLAMAQLSEDGELDSLQVPQPPYSIGDIITYNGSLEESEYGLVNQQYIPGWSFNMTTQSIFEIQEEEVFHGAKALHIEFGEWDGSMNDWHMEVTNEPVYVSAGDVLRLTVGMKSDREGGKGTLYFGLPESGDWRRYPDGKGLPVELTSEWNEYELEHTVSSFDAQHSMRVGVAMNFEENGGSNIWIDHLRVEKIGETDPAEGDTLIPGTHNVTFEVDMSRFEDFDPEFHELYITGSMTGWAMPGSEPGTRLEQVEADIYSTTLSLEDGYYEYKYFLVEDEPTWNLGEWGGEPNRELMVTGETILTDVFGVEPEPEGSREVTFRVDMSYQVENGMFDPDSGDSVQVRGGFTQWDIQPVSMTHEGDHVYVTTVSVPGREGDVAEYKFAIQAGDGRPLPNGGWEIIDPDELWLNRLLELGAEDVSMSLPVVLFNNLADTHLEVTVRNLNTYDRLDLVEDIPIHPLAGFPVRFEAAIVSHPQNSGLAAYDPGTGQIGRIHVFVVDTDAFESGKEGMYMQLVAEGAVMDDLAERSRGDVIAVEGRLTFFNLVAQFVPATVTPVGMVGEGSYSDYHELLEPDMVDLSELNNYSEWGEAGLNVHTYPDLVNRYVRIENAQVAVSEPADDGRPRLIVGRDAHSAYMRDYSLRFRNDRPEYRDGFNRRRAEDGPFVPPPEGSEVEISGFLTVQDFDDFGLFHGASFSITPWDDGVVWETLEDGSMVRTEPEGWPVDLKVTGEPLPIPRPPHETGDNLVYNGSFEENEVGPADPGEVPAWWFNMTDESIFEFVVDAHHGDIALNIEIGPWNGNEEDWHVEVINEPIYPEEGDVIRASVWMKADSDQRGSHLYLGLPQSGGWHRYPFSEDSLFGGLNVNLTTEWQEYVIEHTVSASDAREFMRFGVAMNLEENEGGRIWIDNLEVIKVDEAPMREVVFSVDMDHHLREGIFQPHTGDFVELRGTMTGWLDAPVRMERMASETDSSEVSTIYSAQVGIPGYEGDEQQYKFAMVAGDGRPLPEEGWEGEVGAGEHGNRILVLGPAGVMQTLPTVMFNEGEIVVPPVMEEHFLNLLITDANDNSIELTGGAHPDATDGYDEEFDLYAPPLPPSGSFDARILVEADGQTEYYLSQIRPDTLDKTVWNIKVQPSSGGMPVRVTWTPPELPAEESLQIRDQDGRVILNMVQHEVWEITEPGHLQFQVVHMTGGQREVQWNANWNLVGMPVQAGHTHFQELFPGGLSGTLFAFDGAYVSREVMNPGRGYWLRFNEGGAATLAGAHVASVDVHLQEGWNLISGPSFEVPVDAVADPDGVILSGTLYGFDGAYVPASQLTPGSGYWIRASASAEVMMGEEEPVNGKQKTPSEALANAIPEDPDKESFDRLLVSDESGHTRKLLFAGHLEEEVNELRFSLPPEPPGDAFDARFAGDRYLVTESAGTITAIAPGELTFKLVLSKLSVGRAYRFAVSVDDEIMETVELADKQEYTISSAGQPVTLNMTTDEKSSVAELPVAFSLSQNYPNPFNPETLIRYSLPEKVHVNLAVYNLLGQKVAVLMNDEQAPGHHEVIFDASRLSSGIYIYRLQAGNYTSTKQMTLIK